MHASCEEISTPSFSLSPRGTSGERAGERGFLNFPAINFPASFSVAVFRAAMHPGRVFSTRTFSFRSGAQSVSALDDGLFEDPLVLPSRPAPTMRREKSAAMMPEPRPDTFAITVRKFQGIKRRTGEKLKC